MNLKQMQILDGAVAVNPEPVIDKSAAIRIATSLGWEPKRKWVGLTDLQKGVIKFNHSKVGMMLMTEYDLDAMLEAAEQALKEKNT